MISMIPRWSLVFAIAVLTATTVKLSLDKHGLQVELEQTRTAAAEREAEYQAERARAAAQLAEASEAVIETQNKWTAAIAEERTRTDETIRTLQRRADDLRQRLRNATQAGGPTATIAAADPGAATDAATASGSAGAVVSGAPGIDLVTEALRADTIRVELIACYRNYEDVRTALAALNP